MSVNKHVGAGSGVPPSLRDAERAVEVLVAAGVGGVVLFGSVARGEQTARSDIDLVAVYDDLDYDQRDHLTESLRDAAEEASGYPVQLVVTDRPEWKTRTEGIETSMERHVASYGRVLADRPPAVVVNWDKPMVSATNALEEARSMLGSVDMGVAQLRSYLEGAVRNRREQAKDPDGYRTALLWACAAAHAVVADSIRALIHLAAVPGTTTWGHNISRLCDRLVEPHRTNFDHLLTPPTPYWISIWHEKTIPAWYEHPLPRPTRHSSEPSIRLVETLGWAACRAALYADAHIPDQQRLRDFVGFGRCGRCGGSCYEDSSGCEVVGVGEPVSDAA